LVLDTATGDVTADLPLLEPPAGLAFDLAGKRLAVVADTVQVWDVAVGRPNWQAALPASGLCVGFGPGGKLLAVGLSDRSVRVWDGRTGSPGGVWRGHAGRVGCVAFAPDGKRLAAGTEQPGQWTVWNLARPQECLVAREYVDGGASPEGLGFAPGGRDLLLAAPARPLLRLDPVTGTRTPVTAGRMGFRAFSPAALFAVTSDGSRVAGPTDVPGEVKVWDAATGAEVTTLPTLGAFVQRVAVSRGGARVAAAGSRAEPDGRLVREVRVWDVATGAVLLARTSPADEPHPALALSADGQRVAAERPAGPRVLVVYDVTDGREIWAGGGHDDRIGGLAFDPAGGRLASGDGSGRVIVRDAATGHRLTADALSGPADVLAFAPDGKRLAGANRESVRVWEPETGQAVLDLGGVPSRASDDAFNPHLCWSADGRALAALRHRGHVVVWRAGP
jgi:WD40 repeat protein